MHGHWNTDFPKFSTSTTDHIATAAREERVITPSSSWLRVDLYAMEACASKIFQPIQILGVWLKFFPISHRK